MRLYHLVTLSLYTCVLNLFLRAISHSHPLLSSPPLILFSHPLHSFLPLFSLCSPPLFPLSTLFLPFLPSFFPLSPPSFFPHNSHLSSPPLHCPLSSSLSSLNTSPPACPPSLLSCSHNVILLIRSKLRVALKIQLLTLSVYCHCRHFYGSSV